MKDVCIVIPIYSELLTEYEKISLIRILKVFKNRDIAIVCPLNLNKSKILKYLYSNTVNYIEFSDSYFKNIRGYNQLMKTEKFYSKFDDYNYILICQLDVLVISDKLDYWLNKNYDNIGAPIFEGYTKPTYTFKNGNNGGFCLRNVSSCLKVLENNKIKPKLSVLWQIERNIFWKAFRLFRDGLIFTQNQGNFMSIINEDIFWSVIIPSKYNWFKNCDFQISMYFAYDANPRLLYNLCSHELPMAIHAWWKYDIEFINEINDKFDLF